MTLTTEPSTAINESADFWCYDIGVNVIPSDTKNKTTNIQWSVYQLQPIPETLHEHWKQEGAFNKGIAIIPGKVWHKQDKQNLYFIFIDADKQKAIDELCGKRITLQEMAQEFLIEQHADNPEKAHIYFYSPIPFPKKSADTELGLEVKGLGEHGIAFCFPSIHKNGHPYEIIGTNQPVTLTIEQAREMIQHIDQICLKHGVQYLEKGQEDFFISSVIVGKLREVVQALAIDTTIRIPQGQRHLTLISIADSILFRHLGKKSEKQLKEFFDKVNYLLCKPEPLPDSEIKSIWNSALGFVNRVREEQKSSQIGSNTVQARDDKDKDKDKDKKEIYIQKFAFKDKLYEAVLIDQKASFLVVDKEKEPNEINIKPTVGLDKQNKTLKPYEQDSYLSRPYEFADELEVEYYKNEAKKYNLDTLYLNLVKPLWKKYIDADNLHLSLCAFDTIATYSQDHLGLTHYLFFVGNNNSGKSNNLYLLHSLAYRNIMSTDMTSANIFRSLGSLDEGQVTICEDELDDLEDDRDKKRIYVNGYCTGVPVFRTEEGPNRSRKPTKYFTYCFKAFAAERLPDVMKAKGFNQRIIELQCTTGFPDYNIKEVNSPAGDETYENLLKELEHARKILLMYRLLHYHDGQPNIQTNLKGREKELFQPLIRLFQNTNSALAELKIVIDHFISNRRENNAQTAHAQVYQSIIRLLISEYLKLKKQTEEEAEEERKEPKLRLEYLFSELWDHFISDLDGQPIPNKKRSADFGDLGEISHKDISKILIEVFGSKRKKTTEGNKAILLNPEKIMRLGTVYDVSSTVKVGNEMGSSTSQTFRIFSDYFTNLTNIVKERAGEKGREMAETLENYG
jgi:hypothetical protein